MTFAVERDIVLAAIRGAAGKAGMPWPPAHDRPVPLKDLIGAYPLTHDEVPGLTRAGAAAYLARWDIKRPDLWEDATPLAGFLFANAAGGYILVRRDDPIPRRRFSAAHEFGHYLLHLPPHLGDDPLGHTIDDDEKDLPDAVLPAGQELSAMERQANLFAAELLMPAEVCARLVARYRRAGHTGFRYQVDQLATDLLVSREAARWRFVSLGLAPAGRSDVAAG